MQLRRFLRISVFMVAVIAPSRAACPVTNPLGLPFVPPAPYPPNAAYGAFWYGSKTLWTQLSNDGVWRGLPRRKNGGYFNKLFLWQEGFDWRKEQQPDVILVLRRLDAEMPLVSQRGGTNAIMGNSPAMLVGVVFPDRGCWEVTSVHDGHTLTFVLSIQPRAQTRCQFPQGHGGLAAEPGSPTALALC
jgi:hypothetical protein